MTKDKHTLINEQVWVEFTIGEYKDKILCRVCEMDSCHLLLGRHWKYDRDFTYHGKKNLYTFKKDGVT